MPFHGHAGVSAVIKPDPSKPSWIYLARGSCWELMLMPPARQQPGGVGGAGEGAASSHGCTRGVGSGLREGSVRSQLTKMEQCRNSLAARPGKSLFLWWRQSSATVPLPPPPPGLGRQPRSPSFTSGVKRRTSPRLPRLPRLTPTDVGRQTDL